MSTDTTQPEEARPSWRYQLLAGLFDHMFWFPVIKVGVSALIALGVLEPLTPSSLGILLNCLVGVLLLYHVRITKMVSWNSLGEEIVGFEGLGEERRVKNRHGRSRGVLFVVIFMVLALSGSPHAMQLVGPFEPRQVAINILVVGLFLAAAVGLGLGSIWWGLIPLVDSLGTSIQFALGQAPLAPGLTSSALAALLVASFFLYRTDFKSDSKLDGLPQAET